MKVVIHLLCSCLIILALFITYGSWYKDWGKRIYDRWGKYLPIFDVSFDLFIIIYKLGAKIYLLGSILTYILVANKYL